MNNPQIEPAFVRLEIYVACARLAAEHGDATKALDDLAEVHFIAGQLWAWLRQEEVFMGAGPRI